VLKQNEYDLVVVGAGLIGASFALFAAQQLPKLRIAVIERSSKLAELEQSNQRVVALGQLATRMLDNVGVFQSLDQDSCYAYQRMFIWDQHSQGELEFSVDDVDLPLLGHMVDSQQCNYLLHNALDAHSQIEVAFNTEVMAIENATAQAKFATVRINSGDIQGSLIVAADGAQSSVRSLVKISTSQHSYEQIGIVAKIRTSLPHQDTAWQRFLETGPLGVLPLLNGESSIVWSCNDAQARTLLAMDDAQFCQELAGALEYRLGEVTLLSSRQSFPLKSQSALRYFNGRVALVGDAAHSIHPLAGQGANLGFKDIECLVDLLVSESNEPNASITKLLARYEHRRKSDNQVTDQVMTLLNSAFLQRNPLWAAMRGFGMRWVSKSSAIKALLTKHAVGAG
jgi:2-octaprenylphenol hydroxylase